MRKKCRKSEFASYIIVDDETGVPVMKKDTLKNKRIDDAELEKVSGGVSLDTSKMDSYDLARYNEFLGIWLVYSNQFQNKDREQECFESLMDKWRNAGFEPDASTFLKNNRKRIWDYALHTR